ncbi:hypothetical protein EDD21DRAFT_65036 [Dissophora ornata]|nr:hypothetical protein EDD21DRAFT_65036 [Dissophora ornata]
MRDLSRTVLLSFEKTARPCWLLVLMHCCLSLSRSIARAYGEGTSSPFSFPPFQGMVGSPAILFLKRRDERKKVTRARATCPIQGAAAFAVQVKTSAGSLSPVRLALNKRLLPDTAPPPSARGELRRTDWRRGSDG